MVTTEITVDAGAPFFEDPFEVEIYAAGRNIMVRTNDINALPGHMKVYSTSGRLVMIHTLERSAFNRVSTNLQPGIYIVTLQSQAPQQAPVRQKVLIR